MSDKQKKEIDYSKLQFVRVFTPLHVPKHLLEQVKTRSYEVDDWYRYQMEICTKSSANGPVLNPFNLLYVITDDSYKVVGMLWAEIVDVTKKLIIQTFSMDREYWGGGKAVQLLADKAKEIAEQCKLKSVIWCTNYPKHSERYGFKRSRSVLMEFTELENGRHDDGKCETHGKRTPDDQTTGIGAESNATGIGSGGESGTYEFAPGDGPRADARNIPTNIRRSSNDDLRAGSAATATAEVC